MNQTSETLGRGDCEAAPEQDVASLLPRTIGQISLLHNMNDTEPDATLTNLDQTSSSSSTLTLMPSSTTVLADPVVCRYELDQLRLQVKRFIPDDLSPALISTNMAKKIISQGLLALNHPNVISAAIAIVTVPRSMNTQFVYAYKRSFTFPYTIVFLHIGIRSFTQANNRLRWQ